MQSHYRQGRYKYGQILGREANESEDVAACNFRESRNAQPYQVCPIVQQGADANYARATRPEVYRLDQSCSQDVGVSHV